jgi:hypothetical protein
VDLQVLEYWNNPPTFPTPQKSQQSQAASLYATNHLLGEYQTASVTGDYDVSHSLFAIPGNKAAVFSVNLAINHWTDGGFTQVDFSSGDFEIRCPALILEVLT